jgi:hypothetical protein
MAKSTITGQELDEDNIFASIASGTGFSSPYGASVLPPDERQEQEIAEEMQLFAEKSDPDRSFGLDDLGMAARAFVDGLWLNKGEEISAQISSAIVMSIWKATEPELYEAYTRETLAKEILGEEEAKSARFAEERPITSAVSNIAGNILSPVSIKAGQMLSAANKIRSGAQAARVQDDITRTLLGSTAVRSDDAALLAAQLGRQEAGRVASLASRVPTPVAASVVSGGEGFVIGFEGKTAEEKTENALWTAGISAAVPFAFEGVKQTYNFATKPKMAQELGEGANFINLMFTDHGLSNLYRSVVSKAYGGRSLTEQQARQMAGRSLTPKAARAAAEQIKSEAARKLAIATNSIGRNVDDQKTAIQLDLDKKIQDLSDELENAAGKEERRINLQIDELEEAKVEPALARVLAVKEADEAVASANAAFRGRALRESAPAGATDDEINALGALAPQDANLMLDDLWKKYGFTVANGKQYTISSQGVIDFIDGIRGEYSELALIGAERGGVIKQINDFVLEEIKRVAPSGQIKGEDLVQLTSSIGRAINGLSSDAVSTRKFSSEVQGYLQSLLEKGLSKSELETLAADRFAWGIRSTVDDAIARASGGEGKIGNFTASDYLNAIRGFSKRFAARGQGRLQKEAQQVASLQKGNESNIVKLADIELQRVKSQSIKERSKLRGELSNQKAAIKAEKEAAKRKARQDAKAAAKNVDEKARIETAAAKKQEQFDIQIAGIDDQIAKAERQIGALETMTPSNFTGSVFENLFNTVLIGQGVGTVVPSFGATQGIAESIALGFGGAKLLATETAQRVLARQSKGQKIIRSAVDMAASALPSSEALLAAQPAAVGQVIAGPSLMFSEQNRKMVMDLPPAGKAALYTRLEAQGRLERLKQEDPDLFKALKAARR